MVSTRSREKQQNIVNQPTQQEQQQHQQQAGSGRSRIPTAVEQEQQHKADRALIAEYRQQWQSNKSLSQTAFRQVLMGLFIALQEQRNHGGPIHEVHS
jgi:hypothetical protein